MNPVTTIRARGAIPRIDAAGNLALDLSRVPKSLRPEVVDLARQHRTDIIDELRGGPAGSPHSTAWDCPTGYARHREFWTSEYGIRICSICHPQTVKGGATWKQ